MVWPRLRFVCVVVLVAVMAPFPLTQAASSSIKLITRVTHSLSQHPSPQRDAASTQVRHRAQAQRIKIVVGETREVPLAIEVSSLLIVAPEIASAKLKNLRTVTLTGMLAGETILIVFEGQKRHTFLLEVVGRTYATTKRDAAKPSAVEQHRLSGSYSVSYAAPFGTDPGLIRQSFQFQRKLAQGRTLRFSSEMFKFIGLGNSDPVRASIPGLALDRVSLGVDSHNATIDILDSRIRISPLSFNDYAMRGFHSVSTPSSRLKGLEVFAGLARPSLTLFDDDQGRLLGALLPIAHGGSWRVRTGLLAVIPQKNNKLGSGGSVWHIDGRYSPDETVAAEGEVAYANNALSWRAQLGLRLQPLNAYGEIVRFDRRSPLISIGAQPGGHETEVFGVYGQITTRLHASLSYKHLSINPPAAAKRSSLDRTTLFANATYRISNNSRLGFRYTQQQIETASAGPTTRFRFETRMATVSHGIRFNRSWSNNVEARLNFSRETRAANGIESGMNLKDELRWSFKGGSATGFINYTRRTPSLAGLIIRNPQLLPALLQRAFTADPVRFLQMNRDALGSLLPGVELPQTRGADAGLRLQRALSRINLASELRYSAGEIFARQQRSLLASVFVDLRLDAANSVQVNGSRSFGFNTSPAQSSLTISYVHRFGTESGGGWQFSRLIGSGRGLIEGRVFLDLNGDGNDDADEPGVSGMKVQIDGDRSALTDKRGRLRFRLNPGDYSVAMMSDDLGVRFKAITGSEQRVSVYSNKTVNVSFGVSNSGLIAGRVYNDLFLQGKQSAGNAPGVAGVRMSLHPVSKGAAPPSVTSDASGSYQFRNLSPGIYNLELDPATLPANFRVPAQSSWTVTVKPLESIYINIPQVAERAVSGIVFVDKDGDGKFDLERDEPVQGARVTAGQEEVITSASGAYIVRGLPAGRIRMHALSRWGVESLPTTVELQAQPVTRRAVNLILTR